MNEKALMHWTENVTKALEGFRAELDLIHKINENYLELFKEIVNSLKEIKVKNNKEIKE